MAEIGLREKAGFIFPLYLEYRNYGAFYQRRDKRSDWFGIFARNFLPPELPVPLYPSPRERYPRGILLFPYRKFLRIASSLLAFL